MSPQPMVITTSESRTAASVRIFGVSAAMSMPTSAIACDGGRVDLVGRARSRRSGPRRGPGTRWVRKRGGHLGPAGVVDADEQHSWAWPWQFSSLSVRTVDGVRDDGLGRRSAAVSGEQVAGRRPRADGGPPTIWAAMNSGDGGGGDAGEGVGEHPADGHGRVGERGGAGEPVGGADVGADRGRGQRGPTGPGERRRSTATRPAVATISPRPWPTRQPVLGGDLHGGQVEHGVGQHGAGDRRRRSARRCRRATSRPVSPVPVRRPSSQSAAETTGLKCAPDTGPNIKISTANPNTVAVLFSSSCRPTSPGESCCSGDPGPDHDGDQQAGADGLGDQPPRQRRPGRA